MPPEEHVPIHTRQSVCQDDFVHFCSSNPKSPPISFHPHTHPHPNTIVTRDTSDSVAGFDGSFDVEGARCFLRAVSSGHAACCNCQSLGERPRRLGRLVWKGQVPQRVLLGSFEPSTTKFSAKNAALWHEGPGGLSGGGAWFLVPGAWFVLLRGLCLVLGCQFQAPGVSDWVFVPGPWCFVVRGRFSVPASCCFVAGSRCFLPSRWFVVFPEPGVRLVRRRDLQTLDARLQRFGHELQQAVSTARTSGSCRREPASAGRSSEKA